MSYSEGYRKMRVRSYKEKLNELMISSFEGFLAWKDFQLGREKKSGEDVWTVQYFLTFSKC